ncbi:MAG: VIT1/CCC1 transporter family protein [Parachlamydiaceae bacterium]
MNDTPQPSHFNGQNAIAHVVNAQAEGLISAAEVHGTEIPGPITAGADAARDTSFLVILLSLIFSTLGPQVNLTLALFLFLVGYLIFRVGRSAWLGWFRLERLHRVLEQEKWEIEHNREQERTELKELYRAKGFEGQLLEDVTDVLMADGDRLLKVMIEEELGLSLQNVEHPLKQGIGAGVGVFISGIACLLTLIYFSPLIFFVANLAVIGLAAATTAAYAKNSKIAALIWNVAFCLLSYFLIKSLLQTI